MSVYFKNHNIFKYFKVDPGIGTLTVDVPFTPDYIKVEFHGAELSKKDEHLAVAGEDVVYWDINYVAPDKYQLAIGWSVYSMREIYYRISRLTVDPV